MDIQSIGYLIKTINNKLKANANADLKNHHLTFTQIRVLNYLNSQGGKAAQKDIVSFLGVSHTTVCGILSRMELSGYIQICAGDQDRRSKIVCLTQKARSVGSLLDRMIREHEEAMLCGLSEEETRQMVEILTVIYQNLVQM